MKAINSKNSINSMNPTNTTTINEESYNFMDVPKIRLLSGLALGAVLISRDSDLQQIDGLTVEDWTA
jgi:hypothetical protein